MHRLFALWVAVLTLIVPWVAHAQAGVPATVDEVVRQTGQHEGTWIPVAAIVIWLIVQIVKQPQIPIPLPPYARPLIAVVLGQVYGLVIEGVVNGQTWMVAILRGLLAAGLPVFLHEVGSGAATAIKKGPAIPPGAASLFLMLVLGGASAGCAASEKLIETLHNVEDLNDAQTQIAEEARPCFKAQDDRDEAACNGDEVCKATVRANANRRADLYDTVHAKQCGLNPLLDGCSPAKGPR